MSEADKYIETFRQEADELLADIEQVILVIEENPEDSDAINRLFRAMHTIKGSGAMFGFDKVASFTHHVETVLDKVRDGIIPVTREFIDLVLASRDHITAMMGAANGGPDADEAHGAQLIVQLNALLPGGEKCSDTASAAVDSVANDAEDAALPEAAYHIKFRPDPSIFATGMDPGLLLDELRELGACQVIANTDEIPNLGQINPELCYISWDIILSTKAGLDAVKDVFIFVEDGSLLVIEEIPAVESTVTDDERRRLGEILVSRGDADPEDVDWALANQKRVGELLVESGRVSKEKVVAALAEQSAVEKQQPASKNETVRVPADKLDQLINLVGELVINEARLTQMSANCGNSELAQPVEELGRLIGELRDSVLDIRMMPIGTTFGRFKRLVRDMSADLGKEIDLVTEGAETEMDKTVIDRLSDPLVHLIRNSIDHGIESPEERAQAGKTAKGTIRLAANHRGAHVVVTIQDDGKGLNTEAIRAKAVEKGLVSADADLSDREVYSLIFLPGFSTAKQVTNVSGRGVGMDVVKREIDALRGSISVSSETGHGTTIDLALPLTLAIIDGLLVDVGGDRFVIPLSAVEECLEMDASRYAMGRNRNVIQVRGEAIPFVRLRDMFGIAGKRTAIEEVVVVGVGDLRVAVVVDQVIGDHQTVIKSLSGVYRDVESIAGATIMGDGNVALIIDVSGLVRCARSEEAKVVAAIA